MSTPKQIRATRLTVVPTGEPLFSEQCVHVEIEDEAGGEFIVIRQQLMNESGDQTIRFDPDEWPQIAKAVETLLADIAAQPANKPVSSGKDGLQ